nr:immunoglobulin light chain junction region [Macaca mulatta]MOX57948.1 immunoglobulin light chain junction region [Macaca mulatta]
CQQCNNWNTF